MHLDKSCTWFRSSCDSKLKKCSNSQTWQNGLNNQNHARAMKIWPKTEKLNLTSYERIYILDHEETSLIRFRDVFHEFRLKLSFYNPRWKSLPHGVWWKKKLEVWWKKWFVFWKWSGKFKFSYLEKFSHFTNFNEMKKSKTRTKSSQLSKISNKLSLLVSPFALQVKMRIMGSKIMGYIGIIGEG